MENIKDTKPFFEKRGYKTVKERYLSVYELRSVYEKNQFIYSNES